MSLSLNKTSDADFLRFTARFCGVNTSSAASGPIRLRMGAKSSSVHQVNTICKYFARASNREEELCGASALEKAEIAMWMAFSIHLRNNCDTKLCPNDWTLLNQELALKSYLVGNRVTLADAAVFFALFKQMQSAKQQQRQQFCNLVRWFDQMQHTVGVRGFHLLEVLDLEPPQVAFTK